MTLTDRDEAGKLFIGGLSWETSKEKLQEYFSRYGQVVDSVVMKNSATGRSRGFGFVTFSDPEILPIVLASGPHKLDGRTIDPKSCTPRSQQRGRSDSMPKLFLGGLPPGITETEIRQSFSRFGRVHDVNIMYDQEKRKCRGFGFLSFETEDATHQACAERYVDVSGKQIECKLAVPRESPARRGRPPYQQQYQSNQNESWSNRRMPSSEPTQSWPTATPSNTATTTYSSGWGSVAPPQPAYSADGSYSSGYQGYNATSAAPTVYSPYSAPVPTQYNQTAYTGYSTPAQPPPASTVVSGNYTTAVATTAPPPPTDYSAGGGYGQSAGAPQTARGYGQQQPAYHPYRR